jgi:hypothetical protein
VSAGKEELNEFMVLDLSDGCHDFSATHFLKCIPRMVMIGGQGVHQGMFYRTSWPDDLPRVGEAHDCARGFPGREFTKYSRSGNTRVTALP